MALFGGIRGGFILSLPTGDDQTYQLSFLAVLTHLRCPVAGCQRGGGGQLDQHTGSLCALSREIFQCDIVGVQPALPPPALNLTYSCIK